MLTDSELLQNYLDQGTQDSFSALVERHRNLVYSAARRQVQCPALAQDVAQSVFCDLARSAGKLRHQATLTSWLYQVTRRTAIDFLRRESRRAIREEKFAELQLLSGPDANWKSLEACLDEAMEKLPAQDRALLLARFFENRTLKQAGELFSLSEDATQKRLSRALERLRRFYRKRGFTISAAGLAAALSTNAVQTAPALVVPLATATSSVAANLWITSGILTMNTLQKTALGTTLCLGLTVAMVQLSPKVDEKTTTQPTEIRPEVRETVSPPAVRTVSTETGAEERKRLQDVNRELEQQLQEERHQKYLAEHANYFSSLLASKLASPEELPIPRNLNEAAVRSGNLHRKLIDFVTGLGENAPAPNTPEWKTYRQQAEALATELAACIEFGRKSLNVDESNIGHYYGTSLAAALDLNEGQEQTVKNVLSQKYAEGFRRKLNKDSKPSTGVEAWEQQRKGLSRQAYAELQTNLTPAQQSEFRRLYADDFLWKFNIGGR